MSARVAALIAQLDDPSPKVRHRSLQELYNLGPAAEPATGALAQALRDPKLRTVAKLALVKIGLPAVPVLERLLDDPDTTMRGEVVQTLWLMGPAAGARTAEPLARALNDPHPLVRMMGAMGLSRLGRGGAGAVPSLLQALDDPQPMVRKACIQALGEIGELDASVAQKAIAALEDADSGVREETGKAIEKLAPRRRGPWLQGTLPVLDRLSRQGSLRQRALYREIASIVRVNARPGPDLPLPAECPVPSSVDLPRPAQSPDPSSAALPRARTED
jgi:HEAT repeat protein